MVSQGTLPFSKTCISSNLDLSFPKYLSGLPLSTLVLDDNLIGKIPPTLSQLRTIVDLSLANNQVCFPNVCTE